MFGFSSRMFIAMKAAGLIILTLIPAIVGQCPAQTDLVEGMSLTCFPPSENGSYPDGAFCISSCDYNTFEHNCQNGRWDRELSKSGCECEPLGSARGGSFECFPTLSISSRANDDTKCIFVCDEKPMVMTSCSQRKWSLPVKEIACEAGFHCKKLDNPTNGEISCDDTFIEEGIECTLECADGFSSNGKDRFECMTDGSWSFGNDSYNCHKSTHTAGPGVLIMGGIQGGSTGAQTSFFAPESATSEADCFRGLASMRGGPRSKAAATLVDSKVVVCGGLNEEKEPLDTCVTYNPELDKWADFPAKMVTQRQGAAAVIYYNNLMIFGGQGGNQSVTIKSEVYDADSQSWSEGLLMPSKREIQGHCALVIEDHLYLIGGSTSGTYTGLTYILQGDKWQLLDQMYLDRSNHACIYATLPNGQKGIFVSGGMPGDALTTTEFYSFTTNSWEILASMNSPRYGHGLVQLGSKIYAFGGINMDTVEEYDTQSNKWTMLQDTLEGDSYQFAYIPTSHCLKPE